MTHRVLHAIAWPGGLSGAPRSLEESCAALLREGVDAHAFLCVAARHDPSPMIARLAARGVPTVATSANTWMDAAAIARLARSLRRLGPGAILHTHGERALLWGLLVAPLVRARHVHTIHGFIENDAGQRWRATRARELLRRVDAVLAVHEAVASGAPGAEIVPNCLDPRRLQRLAGDRERTRRHLGLREGQKAYLFLGRLSPEKGADRLAVIQARLQTVSAAARLFVAGSGPLAAGVEAMRDVALLGEREDFPAVLAAVDAVLMPSRREGLPMTALEAAALSIPLVGFPVGGLLDSRLAITVPDGNVDALVDTAVTLVRDEGLRRETLRRSEHALASRFDPRAHAERLRGVYDRVGAA